MIKYYQHTSLSYTQLWLLNDANNPAHGLENNNAANK